MSGMTENDAYGLLIRLNERMEGMARDVEQLKHVLLEGNGSPSLTVQVATINTRLHSLEETNKDYRIPRHVWVGIVVSALIGITGIAIQIKNIIT